MNRRGGLRNCKSLDGRENYTSISIDDDQEEQDSNNKLATYFVKQMEKLPETPSKYCICRVPPPLRVLNEKVYTPKVVSIGPFHHNQKELKAIEEHKLRCMKVFLGRTRTSLDDFIMAIKGFEMRARNCYAEKIDLNVNKFVKILLLDSFFIFEVMIHRDTNEQDFYLPIQPFFFTTDIILLENQIPFFVLNHLYLLAFPTSPRNIFHKISINYIFYLMLLKNKNENNFYSKVEEYLNLGNEINHLVDLLRICHLPLAVRSPSENIDQNENMSVPNAMQLQEAGIQLLKLDTSDSLLDINYDEGLLKIPPIVVQDCSEIVLSNILALEKCHYLFDSGVKDFVFFMQMLVDTDKDADLLIQNGIIEDQIGKTSSVAALLNKVAQEVLIYFPSYYFRDTFKGLNTYCSVTQNKWKATFKRDYCSTPWMIASTMAAVILLILTLLSTIAAFLAL